MNTSNFNINSCKDNAKQFYNASVLIAESSKDIEWLQDVIVSYTVNIILSCELYLKALLFPHLSNISEQEYRTHKISELYNLLKKHDENITDQIENIFYKSEFEDRTQNTLNLVLSLCDDSFIAFRYSFENNKLKTVHLSGINTFVKALMEVCDK